MLNFMPADSLKVLVACRSQVALGALETILGQEPSFSCTFKLIVNGHTDPLHGVDFVPDILLLRFDAEHLAELATLAEYSSAQRPALVVIGPAGSADATRLAVRSGARDILFEPVRTEELIASLVRVGSELRRHSNRGGGTIDSVIGAAGGVGASFIACNLAHLYASSARKSTLLLDLDTTYAPLAHFLDVKPERGLMEVLAEVDTLDEHALKGYVSRHRSGLNVLSTVPDADVLSSLPHPERLTSLLRFLPSQYQHVVIDVPHRIDAVGAATLDASRHILIVLEQSVLHVKNGVKLIRVLTRELGIPRERIRAVVNRFSKRSAVTLDDIDKSLDCGRSVVVPNQYQLSIDSIDSAVPVFEMDKAGPVVRSLLDLQADLAGAARTSRSGLFGRIPLFARK